MRRLRACPLLIALGLVLLPAAAHAQATLTGTVRDNSGAVLPGVTVEASSPVLIEKARAATTDGTGQYRITDLPPGMYTMTFTLSGFTSVKREAVEVSGSRAIQINADLRLGALQETITVTGETPLVDTQTTRREMVLTNDVLNTLPATRTYGALLNAIPGLSTNTGSLGAMATPDMTFFTANGGRQNGGQVQIDGMPVAASFNGGGVSTFTYDVANAAEMQVLVSGGLGEAENGEPRINLVPQSGGNAFRGQGFYSGAGEWSAGSNLTPELQAAGISAPPTILKLWDLSGTYSGPIFRDRLWFFGNLRQYGNYQVVEGVTANRLAGTAGTFAYENIPGFQARTANSRDIWSLRFTTQLSDRNRISVYHEYQHRCSGTTLTQDADGCRKPGGDWIGLGTTTASPESWPGYHDFPYNVTQVSWSSPLSSRMLLEAGFSRFHYLWAGFGQAPPDDLDIIPVVETQARDGHRANFQYRGIFDPIAYAYADNDANPNNWKASLSYVTGAHNIKVGYQGSYQRSLLGREANDTLLVYRSNTLGPAGSQPTFTGFGFYIAPRWEVNDRTATQSLYAQDQWTLGRLTVQGAVRYDRAWSWAPAEGNGTTMTSPFNPTPKTFPRTPSVEGYNDITTRWGAAWDVFGTGRTALKVNLGKYLQTATNDENYAINNPAGGSRFVTYISNRAWTDNNGNQRIDCDIMNFGAQGPATTGHADTCGGLTQNNLNFGSASATATRVNPEILRGWGVRPADWGLNVSVQHEIVPRVSAEVSYNRRSFQNFFVTDNLEVGAADFERFTITAPQHAALPGGGGFPIELHMATQAAANRAARNYITFESDFGDERSQYWHGVTTSATARLGRGVMLQGGTTTGRGVRDRCDVARNLPEEFTAGGANIVRYDTCSVTEPWMTSVRGSAQYTVPKVDVLVSAQFRSVNPSNALPGLVGSTSATNGASLSANAAVPNGVIQQSIGRLPPGQVSATATTTINLLKPAQLYPDSRVNQVDMRFAKIFRFGSRRADIGVDLYNLLNTSDATAFNQSYTWAPSATVQQQWRNPTSIVNPRFARFNLTLSF